MTVSSEMKNEIGSSDHKMDDVILIYVMVFMIIIDATTKLSFGHQPTENEKIKV